MIDNKKNPLRTLGALAPSSKFLANYMTRFLADDFAATNILEVGAGTGAITKKIAQKITACQKVDVVEIMPQLAQVLTRRFGFHPQIKIHCTDLLYFETDQKYDLIICSLPFNSLPPEVSEKIIERLVSLARKGSIITFFEYKSLQKFIPLVLSDERLQQYYHSRKIIDHFLERYAFDSKKVSLNFPPALVHYLRID